VFYWVREALIAPLDRSSVVITLSSAAAVAAYAARQGVDVATFSDEMGEATISDTTSPYVNAGTNWRELTSACGNQFVWAAATSRASRGCNH
jgi:hypothetical protein